MRTAACLGLVGTGFALTEKVQQISQKPLLANACPSDSVLHNSECRPADFGASFATDNIQQNHTVTLEEARELVQDVEDFPWTFLPECYSNGDNQEPLCVFSDQNFASGRGIVLVTTSPLAYQMLKKPAFSQPDALSRINQHDNPPFEERDFPGKGRGLVANKTLHRGDQIFASTPLVLTHPAIYDLVESERLRLQHHGVDTLPPTTQSLFWKLLGHFKGDPVEDRINTNAFDIAIDHVQQYAVMPEIAMLNHDCRPNAAYFWDEETLSHYVHATQTIYPGEEITITYINNERKREARMAHLKANWGFDCTCSSCAAHPVFAAGSDARMQAIEDIIEALNDWSSSSTATPEVAELLISLYEQERLQASMGVAYKHASEVYSSFGDRYMAIKYAQLSIELLHLDRGFNDVDVRFMIAMAKDPEQSWSWKKRVGHKRFEGSCGHVH
ncbi:SET domain-containing protein [Bimuria novae-zelandiae CBS 107.79]|uniref:SET domain-containing protein n=1 Tax=Bimuria novae-zelandiae CBS 107.79 TaxID=1447943 RepID=A0A6A5UZZ1_9PLEO|nr:SET domain-containing protein [Bimuria novae-zelandiae CBS 107.79]